MRALPFLITEALVNLRRHGLMTAAAITTIAVALLLVGSFVLTFIEVNVAAQRAAGEFEMRVFCLQTVTKAQIPALEARIRALPGVSAVAYIPKEKAFADAQKDLPISTAGMPNVFPEALVVNLSDPQHAGAVADTIRGWHESVDKVALPEADLKGVLSVANFLRTIGTIGGVLLLLGALVVVSNTIRISLFARRREIKVMQIVGASGWFIRLPLLLEGLIHGIAGGIVAAICLSTISRLVRQTMATGIPMLAHYFEPLDMVAFGLAIVLVGALIGGCGSLLSMRRYLKIA